MKDKPTIKLPKEVLDGLTDEQKKAIHSCTSIDELTKTLGEMGVALPDEIVDDVAGGDDLFSLPSFLAADEAVCKRCFKPFVYFYVMTPEAMIHHDAPDYCNLCKPLVNYPLFH